MKIRNIVIIVITLLGLGIYLENFQSKQSPYLEVAVLDVGQGDALLITDVGGFQMLIDSGPDDSIIRRLEENMPLFDKSIDVILLTHPDKDHIGGFSSVLDKYDIGAIIDNAVIKDTESALEFREKSLIEKGATIEHVQKGDKINFPSGAQFEILHPENGFSDSEINNYSITGRLVYGNTSMLFTGDIDSTIEMKLIKDLAPKEIESTVLKIPHHGSRYSSAVTFLRYIDPEFAVASYECDNSYGHPHQEAVVRYEYVGIPVYTTCDRGTIVLQSDGEHFWVKEN